MICGREHTLSNTWSLQLEWEIIYLHLLPKYISVYKHALQTQTYLFLYKNKFACYWRAMINNHYFCPSINATCANIKIRLFLELEHTRIEQVSTNTIYREFAPNHFIESSYHGGTYSVYPPCAHEASIFLENIVNSFHGCWCSWPYGHHAVSGHSIKCVR